VFAVVAGILPAVEPGILPGGPSVGICTVRPTSPPDSGRQDAALYGNQDGRRYHRRQTAITCEAGGERKRLGPCGKYDAPGKAWVMN